MMLSPRRLAASVTQNAIHAYQIASTSLSQIVPASYQPVAQDTFSDKPTSSSWTRRNRKSLVYGAAVLSVLFVTAAYWNQTETSEIVEQASLPQALSRERYIEAVLQNPVVGLFDPAPIRAKCDATKFQEGLVWQCAVVIGGIGNVSNMLLNCVRYAIEAGATTLILPRLGARSDNLFDLGGEDRSVELSTSFDVQYLLDRWQLACPQIHAVVSGSEVAKSSIEPLPLEPQFVSKFNMTGKYMINDHTGWRHAFDRWLDDHAGLKNMTAETPVWVRQHWTLANWNPDNHSPEFVRSFPRLFQHPLQTRRLAASALWALEQKLGRPVVAESLLSPPQGPLSVTSIESGRIAPGAFMGAHLRVAADAVIAGFPGYYFQAPFYLFEAARKNLKTIFLATGSPEHREKFREHAKEMNMTVYVKENLLNEVELAELKSLTWDQQALVDYDILIHSSWFSGAVRSSFSWLLVSDRLTLPEARNGTAENGVSGGKKQEIFQDGLSSIAGNWESPRPPVGTWPM